MRIACASGKGGCGKTSVSALLALSLAAAGKGVKVCDFDPQRGFMGWLEHLAGGGAQGLRKVSDTEGTIGEGEPAHVIGDFAPEEPAQLARKVAGWDLVLVPTRPSPLDVKAAAAFVAALDAPDRARLLWNCLDGSKLSDPEALASMLRNHPGLKPMRAGLKNRAAYRYAQVSGLGALTREAREELLAVGMEVFA
jgi:cellulose biosynthesis protein BcsQ